MEDELKRFIQVWLSAIVSVCYCYYIPPRIKAGAPRFFSILPVCVQFFVFPMLFSSSVFIYLIMYFLTLMGSVKLILLAFDKGPLFPLSLNLLQFICLTCFPVEKLQENPKSQPSPTKWNFAIKCALLGVLLHVLKYKQNLPSILFWVLQPFYMYLPLEITLTLIKSLFTIILGCELKPVFDEPYLATSLQDFWGRRWNLVISSILWSCIYAPIRGIFKGNPGLAKFIGVFMTFLVSGLIHELLRLCTSRTPPSGGITLFYVLQGVCTAVEVTVKRSTFGRRWAVRPVVSWFLTMSFLFATSNWLYFPQITRGKTLQY
uniref:long-chain-alcohol O-fatty-acyltransferase n=1 Tax=Noccaea caerulescens TaxID=107243 RepID=A0A1J3JLM2_NOCCA